MNLKQIQSPKDWGVLQRYSGAPTEALWEGKGEELGRAVSSGEPG